MQLMLCGAYSAGPSHLYACTGLDGGSSAVSAISVTMPPMMQPMPCLWALGLSPMAACFAQAAWHRPLVLNILQSVWCASVASCQLFALVALLYHESDL